MLFKKIICPILFFISSISFGLTTKGQVDLIPPTGIEIKSGVSSWSAKLSQPIQVNPLQVYFWNTNNRCNVIPVTSVSVKYVNDIYWYNTAYGDNGYQVENYMIEAVKLDFYLEGSDEFCVIKVSGCREIGKPTNFQ